MFTQHFDRSWPPAASSTSHFSRRWLPRRRRQRRWWPAQENRKQRRCKWQKRKGTNPFKTPKLLFKLHFSPPFYRESLEAALKVATQEKALLKAEAEKTRRQVESAASARLTADRELVMLRAKLDAQAEAVEEYEKMRRQHAALHEELNRLRADNYDLAASGKEAARLLATAREEAARARELAEKERANGEEARLSAERWIAKAKGRFEEERAELGDRIAALERENCRLKGAMVGAGGKVSGGSESVAGNAVRLNEYSRLRAKQYGKIASRLGVLLEQLKVGGSGCDVGEEDLKRKKGEKVSGGGGGKQQSKDGSRMNNQNNGADIQRELEAIQRKQAELEAELLEQVGQQQVGGNNSSSSLTLKNDAKKRWKVKLADG